MKSIAPKHLLWAPILIGGHACTRGEQLFAVFLPLSLLSLCAYDINYSLVCYRKLKISIWNVSTTAVIKHFKPYLPSMYWRFGSNDWRSVNVLKHLASFTTVDKFCRVDMLKLNDKWNNSKIIQNPNVQNVYSKILNNLDAYMVFILIKYKQIWLIAPHSSRLLYMSCWDRWTVKM